MTEEKNTDASERPLDCVVGPAAWLLTGGRLYADSVMICHENAKGRVAERNDGTRLEPLYSLPTGAVTLEVWAGTDDQLDFVAGIIGPRDRALSEAMHYASQYASDDMVRVIEVLRVPLAHVPWTNDATNRMAATPRQQENANDE